MIKSKTLLFTFSLLLFFVNGGEVYSQEREVFIKEKVKLYDLGKEKKDVKIWLPYPVNDEWQTVEEFELNSPLRSEVIQEKEYGNRIVYLYAPNFKEENLEIDIKFKVRRKEYDFFHKASQDKSNLYRFLKPNHLIPVSEDMQELARSISKNRKEILGKAKAIYNYLIREFTYSKDNPEFCGIGNVSLTLKYKKGICTDYHSVFISLLRSLKIPARFEIGFPLSTKKEGEIKGYHCWAKYYIKDKGWFPVDVSEADKHPPKKDYFFGRLDENRVHLSTGRDIYLPYAKDVNAMPLNYFVYPYAEVDGEQFLNIDTKIYFSDEGGGGGS
jgi:transglutaminase-like putative cysteine protease